MKTRLAMTALLLAIGSAAAQEARQAAAEACEREVIETVKRMRGNGVQDVQFTGNKRVLAPISDDETGIQGEGRWRNRAGAQTPFSYSCTYNASSNSTSGVMFRESRGAVAVTPPRAARGATRVATAPIESTEACESAVAQALQDKHPRVGRIVFGSDTRQVRPAPEQRTSLEGEGAVQPAPGMSQVRFSYSCVFDPRTGKVDRVQTRE